jgi:rhamnosyl/mannosyltransferase
MLKRTAHAAADRVRFLGFIPDAELVAYFDACDVFCLPSVERAEQFGLVQVEAMHCGKPVVSTRLGTGVEFVNQEGIMGSWCAERRGRMAAAINRLLSDLAFGAHGRGWPRARRAEFQSRR